MLCLSLNSFSPKTLRAFGDIFGIGWVETSRPRVSPVYQVAEEPVWVDIGPTWLTIEHSQMMAICDSDTQEFIPKGISRLVDWIKVRPVYPEKGDSPPVNSKLNMPR